MNKGGEEKKEIGGKRRGRILWDKIRTVGESSQRNKGGKKEERKESRGRGEG